MSPHGETRCSAPVHGRSLALARAPQALTGVFAQPRADVARPGSRWAPGSRATSSAVSSWSSCPRTSKAPSPPRTGRASSSTSPPARLHRVRPPAARHARSLAPARGGRAPGGDARSVDGCLPGLEAAPPALV